MNMFSRFAGGPTGHREPANDLGVSAHSMIAWSRIAGTYVLSADGAYSGQVRDLSIDKRSGRVEYVLVARGGFLGFSEKLYALPWQLLRFDPLKDCYKVSCTSAEIKRAPPVTGGDLEWYGCGDEVWRARILSYYNPYLPMI